MAHKGKHYKLQFRRDLTIDQFQTTGAAEAYKGRIILVQEDPPAVVLDRTSLFVNLDKSSDNDRVWTSGQFTFLSRQCRCQLTIREAWKFFDTDFKLSLQLSNGSPLLEKTGRSVGSPGDWRTFFVSLRAPFDFQSASLPRSYEQFTIEVAAAGYADYNP